VTISSALPLPTRFWRALRSISSRGNKLERVGYIPVRNADAEDGMIKVCGKRQAVYSLKKMTLAEQIKAARLVR
jgi:hypothetical protein